jgi:site-specific DNA-methyltransferase (adenine-specific)
MSALADPYYQRGGITIYHGDCRDVLPSVPTVGLLLTDPPYGIGDKWAASKMVGKRGSSRLWGHGEVWDNSTVRPWLLQQAIEKAHSAIVWGGNYYDLPPSRGWLSWDKMQDFSGAHFELAWTNLAIPARVVRMSRIDAYQNRAEHRKEHPTEKPTQLMRWCIGLAGDQAQTVIDPFMGCGSTVLAARALGRSVIGIEIEERYCEIAAKRLEQEVLPLEQTA